MEDYMEDNIKKITIVENSLNNKKVKVEKEKEKRVVTKLPKWTFNESDFLFNNQFNMVQELIKDKTIVFSSPLLKCVLQELNKKVYGYKQQDIIKELYDESIFITIEQVLSLLQKCKMDCFYCKEKVNIIYESVREPKQWSLERIDNNYGHNNDNVEIACLKCNLSRRTMYHERFVFTKQIGTIKKIDS